MVVLAAFRRELGAIVAGLASTVHRLVVIIIMMRAVT